MKNKTVKDAAEAWIKRCQREGLDTQTIRTYRCQVQSHILPCIGDKELATLRRADIVDFKETMLDANSYAMTRKVMVSLRSLLSVAVDREWIDTNPADGVKMKRGARHKQEVEIPSKEQIRSLLDAAATLEERAMITVLVFTGMRISEVLGLPWENVDFDRKLIRVRQRASKANEIGPPKSRAGRRDIPMAPAVERKLRAWQAVERESELGLVFPNRAGRIHNYGNLLRRMFKPLCMRAGVVDAAGEPAFGFHALRHAAASMMIEQGWQPKKIQTILGHSSITVTFDTYGHLFTKAEDDLDLFAQLEEDLLAA